jgi:hypothetical protein
MKGFSRGVPAYLFLTFRFPLSRLLVSLGFGMKQINDVCCADCGGVAGEGISLKACKSCMLVRYCNADCQKNHWPIHKKECKQRAAELRDEALFKDPPANEECPICFLPMPANITTRDYIICSDLRLCDC